MPASGVRNMFAGLGCCIGDRSALLDARDDQACVTQHFERNDDATLQEVLDLASAMLPGWVRVVGRALGKCY